MKNITVSLNEETYRLAHVRATEAGTSVSALVRAYLNGLAADRGGEVAAANEPDAEGERELELERRRRRLDEFFADLDARRLGLRASDRLTRNEMYDEAINGPDAIWT